MVLTAVEKYQVTAMRVMIKEIRSYAQAAKKYTNFGLLMGKKKMKDGSANFMEKMEE